MDQRALIDDKIKVMLTSTDLTFKQIIERLREENISASFNTIRRVNRDHQFRKPRYDAKLTPKQRKELVVELKNATTKPNLSSLARKYGVCHGTVWYWWKKLNKVRKKNNSHRIHCPEYNLNDRFYDLPPLDLTPGFAIDKEDQDDEDDSDDIENDSEQDDDNDCSDVNYNYGNGGEDDDGILGDLDCSDPLELDDEEGSSADDNSNSEADEQNLIIQNNDQLKIIGAVQAKDYDGKFIRLPILMYASKTSEPPIIWTGNDSTYGASPSSSANSTPTSSSEQQ